MASIREMEDSYRHFMEMMKEPWISIQSMPFKFFKDTLVWKVELEKERNKRIEEHRKEMEKEKRREIMSIRRMRGR